MKIRALLVLLTALPIALLSSCGGGGSSDGNGQVRLFNATSDYAALDFYENGVLLTSNVAAGTAGAYATVYSGTNTFTLNSAGSGITSVSTARTTVKDVPYTLLAYSVSNTLRTALLGDNEPAPPSGASYIRVFNSAVEAGNVDVYFVPTGSSITGLSPAFTPVTTERFSNFIQFNAGSYHVVVTATGDPTDVRLDIPSLTLVDQQVATVVLTSTPGGALVNGFVLNQGGTVSPQANSSARIRVVADAVSHGLVDVSVNGVPLGSQLQSPIVTGAYTLVSAGPLTTDIKINGVAVPTSGLTAAAGADLSLLVLGSSASPQVSLLNDDNRPSLVVGDAKIRVVNGLNGLNSTIGLTANYSPVGTVDPALGQASPYSIIPSSTATTPSHLVVTTPLSGTPLYQLDPALQASSVYTIFMLGDYPSTAVGIPRRDR